MSKSTNETITCPECGHEQQVTLWHSINTKLDPELREELFEARINQFTCEGCGKEALLSCPLLYHDMDLNFCVHYLPPQVLEDDSLYEQYEAAFPLRMKGFPANMAAHLASPHLVFDMNDLLCCVAFYERLLGGQEGKPS